MLLEIGDNRAAVFGQLKMPHHEHHKDYAQILLPEPIVMSEMVALVFESIEGFIFNFPACAAASHKFTGIALCYGKISNPTEMLRFFGCDFPVFQEINQQALI